MTPRCPASLVDFVRRFPRLACVVHPVPALRGEVRVGDVRPDALRLDRPCGPAAWLPLTRPAFDEAGFTVRVSGVPLRYEYRP